MPFYRIFPSKDNWITNEIMDGRLAARATGSNHGHSPTLRIYARPDEVVTGSQEVGRALIQFNLNELSGMVFRDKTVPSGSVSYYLRMFNYEHSDTLPTSFDLFVYPLSRSWDEGKGRDDDEHLDLGYSNWLSASSTQTWNTTGSDFLTANYGTASAHFDAGDEDLEVNITTLVNNWLTASADQAGGLPNNGVVVKLGSTEEQNGTDYFVKIFHGRETIYSDKIPYIEARWADTLFDNRGNFAFNQNNKLYMYNVVRGELTNVTQPVFVRIQDHLIGVSASYTETFTASFVETGIYSASFNIANTASFSSSWYDIWHSGAFSYMTGAFTPVRLTGALVDQYDEFDLDVSNLKRVYDANEEARIKVVARKRDYQTHVLHTASTDVDVQYVEKMYYSVINDTTGETVIPFGTGSVEFTRLSYNKDGNYFNIWMNSFVPGFLYRILFLIDINKYDKKIIDDGHVFKVI
jgi:hypothetical protein